VDRDALDFSIVLEQHSKENHLFPRQMLYSQADAPATSPRTISQKRQIAVAEAFVSKRRAVAEMPGFPKAGRRESEGFG
jgi:hypothetical protein